MIPDLLVGVSGPKVIPRSQRNKSSGIELVSLIYSVETLSKVLLTLHHKLWSNKIAYATYVARPPSKNVTDRHPLIELWLTAKKTPSYSIASILRSYVSPHITDIWTVLFAEWFSGYWKWLGTSLRTVRLAGRRLKDISPSDQSEVSTKAAAHPVMWWSCGRRCETGISFTFCSQMKDWLLYEPLWN